jgi:hypothetical protein
LDISASTLIAAACATLLAVTSLHAASAATAAVPHAPTRTPRQQILLASPHRVPLPAGQRITDHPAVIVGVNAARQRQGWAPATTGSNYAAKARALNYQHCNGVQWGRCGLIAFPDDQYAATSGSAESNRPRGCIQPISYGSFA